MYTDSMPSKVILQEQLSYDHQRMEKGLFIHYLTFTIITDNYMQICVVMTSCIKPLLIIMHVGLRQFCLHFFFVKKEGKSKEQNSGKIGENLEL